MSSAIVAEETGSGGEGAEAEGWEMKKRREGGFS